MSKILIAHNSILVRKKIRNILEDKGFEILGEDSNGIQVYNDYRISKPDIVVIEINLPLMDGITCMNKIKGELDNTKFIVIGIDEERDKIFKALGEGADIFLVEPIDEKSMIQAIERI